MERKEHKQVQINRPYTLEYIMAQKTSLERAERIIGSCKAYHDISLKKWQLTIQLDEEKFWFLSVFFHEDGNFDRFSLDAEAANDAHFYFTEELAIRERLYEEGDNEIYFHQILIRYAKKYGAGDIYRLIEPYIMTSYQFHGWENKLRPSGVNIPVPPGIEDLDETLQKLLEDSNAKFLKTDVANGLKSKSDKKTVISDIIQYRKIRNPGSRFPGGFYWHICGTEYDRIYNGFQCAFLSLLEVRMEEYRKKLMENYCVTKEGVLLKFPKKEWIYGEEFCKRIVHSLEDIYPEIKDVFKEYHDDKFPDCASLFYQLTQRFEKNTSKAENIVHTIFSEGLELICDEWSAKIREEVCKEILL